MARRKKNRGASHAPQAMRDHTVIATPRILFSRGVHLPDLRLVEDRRTYPHEIRQDLFRDISGAPAQISRRPARETRRQVPGVLPRLYHRFETPRRVPVCIRREARRRVLHALRKTGRGSRPGKWTAQSFVRCK